MFSKVISDWTIYNLDNKHVKKKEKKKKTKAENNNSEPARSFQTTVILTMF